MNKNISIFATSVAATIAVCGATIVLPRLYAGPPTVKADKNVPPLKVVKTDAQWKQILSPESYDVLRHEGTERAGSGTRIHPTDEKGVYVCGGCGNPLFDASAQFDSGTGWPSFYQPIGKNRVVQLTDNTLGFSRTEVQCPWCGGHLGHVFDDGPKPTGLRYCMNSVALKFIPAGTPAYKNALAKIAKNSPTATAQTAKAAK